MVHSLRDGINGRDSLNHSCEPKVKFEHRDLVAIREIKASEQITFDFNTTEHDLDAQFDCHRKSERCIGVLRGYRWQRDRAAAERCGEWSRR
jgi:SET domain-containing protein